MAKEKEPDALPTVSVEIPLGTTIIIGEERFEGAVLVTETQKKIILEALYGSPANT